MRGVYSPEKFDETLLILHQAMNALSYRWKLEKLLRSRARVVAAYRKDREKAERAKKGRDEIEGIVALEMHEVGEIDDDIQSLEHHYLIESAKRLFLPVPEFDVSSDAWEEYKPGRVRLSKQAMVNLRAAISKERKERREGAIVWITALTGIIGALTGLVAVWNS